jgi:HEAT repeat protein
MNDRNPAILVGQLASPVVEVRKEAEAALQVLGASAVAALKQGLTHKDREVRSNSALLLAKLGAKNTLGALMVMADEDPDATVRPIMLRAISDLVDSDANDDLKAFLIRKLQHPDMFTRALVCRALGNIGDAYAIQALELVRSDAEKWVRDAAQQALAVARARSQAPSDPGSESEFKGAADAPPSNAEALVVRDAARVGAALMSLDPARQKEAQQSLEAMGEAGVPELSRYLWDEVKSTRRAALQSLGRIGGPRATQSLTDFLQNDDVGSDLRAVALHALAHAHGRDANMDGFPDQLVKAHLDDPDPYVRAAAVVCLLKVGPLYREAALDAALDDDDEWVHTAAFSAIAETVTPQDVRLRPLMVEATTRVTDPAAQKQLLVGLARLVATPPRPDDEQIVGPASYFLENENSEVQRAALLAVFKALRAFDMRSDPTLIDRIRGALERNPEVEETIAESLPRLVQPANDTPLALLARFIESPIESVVALASASLVKIATPAAIDLLVDFANSGQRHARAGALALQEIDPEAVVGAKLDQTGRWQRELKPRCSECEAAPRLAWIERGAREELRCPSCQQEYVLAESGKLYPITQTPFGACLCCTRKQVLVRGGSGQALVCPETGELHVRPHDAPRNILRASALPMGACGCCAEPQPLVKQGDQVVCRRTRQVHAPDAEGYRLATPSPTGGQADIDAINQALLQGTLGIGQSGVPVTDNEDD